MVSPPQRVDARRCRDGRPGRYRADHEHYHDRSGPPSDRGAAARNRDPTPTARDGHQTRTRPPETAIHRRQARRAVDEMYSRFAESMLSRQPGMERVEKEFLLKALHFYQEFSREEGDDPELRFETAKAFR